MAAMAPDVRFSRKHGVVAMVLWTYSLKRGVLSFQLSLLQIVRVSRVSRVDIG